MSTTNPNPYNALAPDGVTRTYIEHLPIDEPVPYRGNARKHSEAQLRQLMGSIKENEFGSVIIIDEASVVIAGHARLEAANRLNMETIPALRLEGLSAKQKRALRLADNKIAENAEWDDDRLKVEIEFLLEEDFLIDVTSLGFDTADLDRILDDGPASNDDDPLDSVPQVDRAIKAISKVGDKWHLGNHAIVCGDATDEDTYDRLMVRERAQTAFTDAPYNVRIQGHVSGLGQHQHREFAMASGEMTPEQFVEFLRRVFKLLARYSADGSIHYICMDWRHLWEILTAGWHEYTVLKNLCVWVKNNGGMGTFYRSRHEFVCVFKNGEAPHINNFELGQHGRYRTNVWEYAGVNTFKSGRDEELAMHPTVKPVAMVADALKDCSNRGDIVLDCFGGSGTTLIAAEHTGRRARIIELDPLYVDTTIRRWQDLTGEKAVHADTGIAFDDIEPEEGAA